MIDVMLLWTLLLGVAVDEAQAKPATAQAADPDRPPIAASEIKALRDSNIFAPRSIKRAPKPKSFDRGPKAESAPPKPKPPLVTGIFFDGKLQAYLVVVEDRNDASLKQFKEPKFLKSGDEVTGFIVGTVTAEKAIFLKGEISRELKVGESLPTPDGKPVSVTPPTDDPESAPDGEEKVEIKPLDPEKKSEVLESLKKQRGKKNRPNQEE